MEIIKEDLEKLNNYINKSYNSNDFYIKDMVTLGVYIIDELSLSSHIQSLPNIIKEIWEIMGESGDAARNSLLWIIEIIKNAYKKFFEIITALIKGDIINQMSYIVEKLISKYDILTKEIHVSFIKYIEYMCSQAYQSILLQVSNYNCCL